MVKYFPASKEEETLLKNIRQNGKALNAFVRRRNGQGMTHQVFLDHEAEFCVKITFILKKKLILAHF